MAQVENNKRITNGAWVIVFLFLVLPLLIQVMRNLSMVLVIVDFTKRKPVWRLTNSRTLSGPLKSQAEINEEILIIMEDYPASQQ